MRERPVKQRPRRRAQELSGDKNLVLVHQTLLGKRPGQARAGFDQHLVDTSDRQLDQQLAQVDLTIVARHDQALRAIGVLFFHRDTGGDQCGTGLEERCVKRHPQAAIDQHTQRWTAHGQGGLFGIQAQLIGTHGQPRIIGQHRIGAGQHHTGLRSQALHRGTGSGTGDPLAFATGHGGSTIQAHGQLDPHEGQAVLHTFEETFIEFARLAFKHTALCGDAGLFQALQAATGDCRVRVLHGRHHPCQPGVDQCIGARRGAAVMAAGLQRHVGGGTTGILAGSAQGMNFGVGFAGAHVPAFADNLPVTYDHTAHPRVGMGGVVAVARQFQGTRHVMGVKDRLFGRNHHGLTGSRARRSISSRNSLRSWKRRYTEAKRM
ncbi:hypothetical protein D3C84_437320 [compost metagenome]